MIVDVIQIFRARSDRSLATKLAVKFAHGQLLDRATAPLLLVHLILWAAALLMAVFIALIIFTAAKLHWSFAIIALVPLMTGLTCAWVSMRLKASLDYIRDLASNYSDTAVDRMLSARDRQKINAKTMAPPHTDDPNAETDEQAP